MKLFMTITRETDDDSRDIDVSIYVDADGVVSHTGVDDNNQPIALTDDEIDRAYDLRDAA